MNSQQIFVVRPLPSSTLEGAFRIHLPPDSLEKLDLKVGEICKISKDDGHGYGIAWRATDKMGNAPKLRPAKMTDIIRASFGFVEGSQVTISKTQEKIVPAVKIRIVDVTPSTDGQPPESSDDGRWLSRCRCALINCEALATDMSFEVVGKKGLKKRFCIDAVVARDHDPGTPGLFTCDDHTHIGSDDIVDPPTPISDGGDLFRGLDVDRIGGLVQQVRELNRRLSLVLNKSRAVSSRVPLNSHILLHGYEGTGKTFLLNQLEEANSSKVFRVDKTGLSLSTTAKARMTTIQDAFTTALNQQPSLILMDDLEKLAPSDDDVFSPLIQAQMSRLRDSRVLVIGAARSYLDVNSKLISADHFCETIELPIPNVEARKQILNVLQNKPPSADDSLSTAMSLKTHGFTGKDLASLNRKAGDMLLKRQCERTFSIPHESSSSEGGPEVGVNDLTDIQADSEIIQHTTQPSTDDLHDAVLDELPTLQDFGRAQTKVRPTALREIFFETPSTQWSDIGGSEEIQKRFDETIGWPLRMRSVLERYHVRPRKGVLLYGPPGCSKTLTAQAVASAYSLNFIVVKGAELISMYVGESERAVREVFRKARQAAPCVIFFDEIDAMGKARDGGGSGSGTDGLNVLTTLLNEMDGFDTLRGVLVLAATNRPQTLDPALIRPGRFDSHVYIGPPDPAARRAILDIALRHMPVSAQVDFDRLVIDTDGYSGAEIVEICQIAKSAAIRRVDSGNGDHLVGPVKAVVDDFIAAMQQVKKSITHEMLDTYTAFQHRGE